MLSWFTHLGWRLELYYTPIPVAVPIILTTLLSLLSVSWVYFKMLRIAHDKHLVDRPDSRKLQEDPVPLTGGLCVFFGIIMATLLACCLMDCTGLIPILMGMSVMAFLGAIDDLISLTPRFRFIFEIFLILLFVYSGGGTIDSLHGLWGIGQFSSWFAVPFTVFACVGVINAVNMIDGVNGLSAGICIACSLLFGLAFYLSGDAPNSMLCFAMAAGLSPFILHNVVGRTSKMFIGNSGTMIMGTLMSWCVIQLLRSDGSMQWLEHQNDNLSLVALALAILSVLVADTLRVMFQRIAHGISPFQADRTHLHHILYLYSGSHSITALIEIFIVVFITASLFLVWQLGFSIETQFCVVMVLTILFVWGGYLFLSHNIRRHTRMAIRLSRILSRTRQGEKAWWIAFQRWVDTPRF